MFTQKNLQGVLKIRRLVSESISGHLEDLNSFVADVFSVNPDFVVNLADSRPFSLADCGGRSNVILVSDEMDVSPENCWTTRRDWVVLGLLKPTSHAIFTMATTHASVPTNGKHLPTAERQARRLSPAEIEALRADAAATIAYYEKGREAMRKAAMARNPALNPATAPVSPVLPRVWNVLANIYKEISRYPQSRGIGIADVVADYNVQEGALPVELHLGSAAAALSPGADIVLSLPFAGQPVYGAIYDTDTATPYVDVSSLRADGTGSRLYMLVLDWAHNNDKTLIPDPAGLSRVNTLRRTSVMASSALRWMTTRHLHPAISQLVRWENPVSGESLVEAAARESRNIAALLEREAQMVFDVPDVLPDASRQREAASFVDDVRDIYFDFDDGNFKRRDTHAGDRSGLQTDRIVEELSAGAVGHRPDAGRVLSAAQLRALVEPESGSGYDTRKSGVGVGTLKRAVVTKSIQTSPDAAGLVAQLAAHAGTDYLGGGEGVLEDILY